MQRDVDEDIIDNSNFGAGEMTVFRLAAAVGGERLRPVVTPILGASMNSPDWRHKYVGND